MNSRSRIFSSWGLPGMVATAAFVLTAGAGYASPFFFSTGTVNNLMAAASRPDTPGNFEIEAADDFLLTGSLTTITSATFTGLLTGASPTIGEVRVEIYRVFPNDSNVGRTSGPPAFSTSQVPTRVNSPSDVAFDERDSAVAGELSFTTSVLTGTFTALNSIQPGGIHLATTGNGPATGQEVQFNISFTQPLNLLPDHYFFVPQVEVTGGEFLWLSGSRPIVAPGTPFLPDLQSWTRDEALDPDWLRIGTDIVGGTPAPTFNGAFTLAGAVPEPGSLLLVGTGIAALWSRRKRSV